MKKFFLVAGAVAVLSYLAVAVVLGTAGIVGALVDPGLEAIR